MRHRLLRFLGVFGAVLLAPAVLHAQAPVAREAVPAAEAASPSLAEVLLERIGPDATVWLLGRSGASAGDLDGDGCSEIALSRDGGIEIRSPRHHTVLATLRAPTPSPGFGARIVPVGDLDADGHVELAVTTTDVPDSTVSVVSPFDGRVLYTWRHGQRADFFGRACAAVGDTDGDGVGDIAIGSGGGQGHPYLLFLETTDPDFVSLYSGRTGDVLWTHEGDDDEYWFGQSVAAVGDVDGDRTPDVAVGEIPGAYFTSGPSPSGRVWILSGRDGHVLNRIDSLVVTDPFGQDVLGLGDVDGDGRPDLAVSSDQNVLRFAQAKPGYVRVVSAGDGRTLYTLTGHADGDEFGTSLALLPDWNGDGAADFAVTAPQGNIFGGSARSGYVRVVSGRDGATLAEVAGVHEFGEFGTFAADAGDVDGDCWPDLLVGESRFNKAGASVYVLSGSALLREP